MGVKRNTTDNLAIFFDVGLHKYTDEFKNTFTSTTTLISKYYEKFDTKKMARLCELAGRRGDPKYKGKSAKQLEQEWSKTSKDACEYGSVKHDYLEQAVKDSTGFRQNISSEFTGNRLLTIKEVIENPGFGELTLDYFVKTRINILYPSIFNLIAALSAKGYRIYAELCVYKKDRLRSGLIDLFLIKDDVFIIIDWKTNKYDLTFEAGYWKKDEFGNITSFYNTHEMFKPPLNHLEASVGNKYALQLSDYAYMAEQFGITCKAIVLCHIRHEQAIDPTTNVLVDVVQFHQMPYLKKEVHMMNEHYWTNKQMMLTSNN